MTNTPTRTRTKTPTVTPTPSFCGGNLLQNPSFEILSGPNSIGDPKPTIPDSVRIGDLILLTKRDLGEGHPGLPGSPFTAKSPNDVAWVEALLTESVVEAVSGAEMPAATRLRHRELLAEASERLRHALTQDEALELAAEDVRLAARALDRITGRIDPEQVLGRIFSTFCIGK